MTSPKYGSSLISTGMVVLLGGMTREKHLPPVGKEYFPTGRWI
jgi:hypothetical protein